MEEFAREGVDHVLVGGYAFAFHAEPRATKDLDVLLEGSDEKARAGTVSPCGSSRCRTSSRTNRSLADDAGHVRNEIPATIRDGIAGTDQMVLADVDADGYADVVTTDLAETAAGGSAYVFHSRGATGVASATNAAASVTFTGPANINDSFGVGLVVGDMNGDGFPDVAVSTNTGSGAAYVFQSTGGAEVQGAAYTAAAATFSGSANSQFGVSLAIGDVNGIYPLVSKSRLPELTEQIALRGQVTGRAKTHPKIRNILPREKCESCGDAQASSP